MITKKLSAKLLLAAELLVITYPIIDQWYYLLEHTFKCDISCTS